MHTDRDSVVDALRSRGDHDRAIKAACALPRHIDTDRDAAVLHEFDLSGPELVDEASESPDDAVDRVSGAPSVP